MEISAKALGSLNKLKGIKVDLKSNRSLSNGWTIKGAYKKQPVIIERGLQSGRYGQVACYTIKIAGKKIVSESSLDRMVKAFEDILSVFA